MTVPCTLVFHPRVNKSILVDQARITAYVALKVTVLSLPQYHGLI